MERVSPRILVLTPYHLSEKIASMPRKPRVEYPGAAYHVMCRGDRQEDIFFTDADRELFLETLAETCDRTGWLIHAYVLMSNHYHLLLETPEANLVAGMRWFQGTFTIRMNSRHRLSGHLFQGRYKALLVDPNEKGYFLRVSSYIHLNPVRARLVKPPEAPLSSFVWSSFPQYLLPPRKRKAYLQTVRVLGELGLKESASGRRAYNETMEEFREEVLDKKGRKEWEAEWKPIRRGWCLGSEEFRDRMDSMIDAVLEGKRRKSYSGSAARRHDERSAEQLIEVGLEAIGLKAEGLATLPKLDKRKQVLAWWVRKQTLVRNRWLSERLELGDEGNVPKVARWVEESQERKVKRLKRKVQRAKIPKYED